MSSKGGGGSWVGVLKVRPIAKNHKKKTKKKRKEPRYIIVYIWRGLLEDWRLKESLRLANRSHSSDLLIIKPNKTKQKMILINPYLMLWLVQSDTRRTYHGNHCRHGFLTYALPPSRFEMCVVTFDRDRY